MGNSASRHAAQQIQRAAGKEAGKAAAAAPPRPPPLGRASADAPAVIEDAEKALQERQQREAIEFSKPQQAPQPKDPATATRPPPPPPRPDINTGFLRGQISDPRDAAQEQFLVHQSGNKTNAQTQEQQELAPDLLKFLQDAGPLEKKVNKELTSPRILKELEQEKGEESEKLHRFEAAQRRRDDMRLVDNIEGFSTPRTTNFFTSSTLEEEKDFGLTDLDLYEMLKQQKDPEQYHTEKVSGAEWSKEEIQQQQQLLKDTLDSIALPVVVKDTDMQYVGLYQKELDKEFAHQKVDIVDESRVKLVVADLYDLGKKEIKRIR
ncbi:expressed unknown protein [Seminavis robusta]|uniref:Uncharacterized protein n=1 Tax=Seminavis robusta TaxID=568900 RepID=A0A9N8EPH1_9STRA|nr:expressed unknown protein [Seminavis robusta]|eukprot:Sro1534_g280500.1 n/a (321) ;mRNA; r:23232-24295